MTLAAQLLARSQCMTQRPGSAVGYSN